MTESNRQISDVMKMNMVNLGKWYFRVSSFLPRNQLKPNYKLTLAITN